jgi:hypothetical protein
MAANQRIAEFNAPDADKPAGAAEPKIGHRADFQPETVIASRKIENDSEQMQLPLESQKRIERARRNNLKSQHAEPSANRASIRIDHSCAEDERSVSSLIRQGAPLGRVAMHSGRSAGRGNFSIAGFLYGCAIGSAAAAAILVIVAAVM